MSEQLMLRSLNIEQDAEALATMFNGSDDQWPGSFTGGVPFNVERIRRWYEEEDALDVFIWAEPDGTIAGYCSLQAQASEKGTGYVHLLNVHPAYQKRSLARRFLTNAVERCVKLGFRRLDLHTWPGNLKAVPLYKKTGFFWMPDTQVYMQNYIPWLLQAPCARPYFDKHDWYATYKRKLEQHEDDERWRGMKVFTYHWEEGGDSLTAWADREGRAITALETDAFFAAAIPAQIKPAKGARTTMRWELRNKGERPLSVSIIARGTEHLKLDYRENLTVAPGETVERSAEVEVDAKTPRVSRRKPAPKIETLLVIDGQTLELGTGLAPEPALQARLMPLRFTLAPGARRSVNLQLRNALDVPVEAQVQLVPTPGLTLSSTGLEIALPPHGQGGLPLELSAAAPGAHAIQALVSYRAGEQQGVAEPQRLPVFALYPGQALACDEEDGIRVDTDSGSFFIGKEGGGLSLYALESDREMGSMGAEFGPPYDPSEFRYAQASLSWRPEGSGVVVTSEQVSQRFPGLALVRELHFLGGPLVRMVYRPLNRGDKEHAPDLMQGAPRFWNTQRTYTIPLRGGLLRAESTGYPAGDDELPRKTDKFAEKWMSYETKFGTVGIIWDKSFEEIEFWGAPYLRRCRLACPPHQWAEPFESWLYFGSGDWRDVQRAWARLAGREQPALLTEPEPIVKLSCEQGVPAAHDGALQPTLKLENRRERKLAGELRLSAPEGWTVQPDRLAFQEVDRGKPFTARVTLEAKRPAPAGLKLRAIISTPLCDEERELPFVVLGDGGKVAVTEGQQDGQAVWTLDNRRMRLTVAPQFAGTVARWLTPDGANHLDSAFPTVGVKSWMAPFYGGICPVLWTDEDGGYPGKLYLEPLAAKVATVKDGQGLKWQGVTLSAELQREPLRGLRVELDYLTTGDSPVLKAVLRLRNATGAVRKVQGGFTTFWAVDGSYAENVLHGGAWTSRRTDYMDSWVDVLHWGAVSNPATGRAAILICPEPVVRLTEEGRSSTAVSAMDELLIPPQGVAERVIYLAVAPDLDAAKGWTVLSGYR